MEAHVLMAQYPFGQNIVGCLFVGKLTPEDPFSNQVIQEGILNVDCCAEIEYTQRTHTAAKPRLLNRFIH